MYFQPIISRVTSITDLQVHYCSERDRERALEGRDNYPHCPHVLLLHGPRVAAELPFQPLECIDEGLGRRDDVKRRRTGAALLEVADPQPATGELPLHVRTFLCFTG